VKSAKFECVDIVTTRRSL